MIEGQLYYDRDPPTEQYHCFNSIEWEIVIWEGEQVRPGDYVDGKPGGWGKRVKSFGELVKSSYDPDEVVKCPRTLKKLSLQCEACGDEELFVHNYKKHMSGSNK